jgi:hypothetical protein
MHRSSESIGAIAAAFAKAQSELINPENHSSGSSGLLPRASPDGLSDTAPLSSGLFENFAEPELTAAFARFAVLGDAKDCVRAEE